MKNLLIILLLVTGVHSLSIPFLSNIMDVVNLVTDISDIVMGRHDLTAGNLFKKKVDPTLAKVNELSEQINVMTNQLNVKMDKIMAAVLEIPRSIRFADLMSKLVRLVTRIDELFDDYQYYVHKFGNFSQFTMEDFSKVTTSHKYGDVQDILRQLYHLFIPGELDQREESLLDLMTDTLRNTTRPEICNQVRTVQQQLYNLYETVVLTEIKGFIMSTYSYGLLSVYHNASFDNEIKKATGQTVFRSNQYLKAVAGYLVGLPRDLFLCDPQKHIKGKNYIAFGSIHQVITHNSMMFDDSWHCLPCSKIDRYGYYRNYSFAGTDWAPQQPCDGRISKCTDVGWSEFCELNSTSDRAYTHLKTQHKEEFGKEDDCEYGKKLKLNVWQLGENDRYRWCTTCLCDCSEDHRKSKKLRALSLRPQIADFDNNMIVTGVRFVEQDHLVHLQIEQGKILAYGQIDKKTIQLKELERFRYDGWFNKIVNGTEEMMREGVDFQSIKSGQQDINLDYVYTTEFGWIVTGVKLSQDPKFTRSIQLELHMTPYDFTTGLLEPTDAKWISYRNMPGNDRSSNQRIRYETEELDSPLEYNDHLPDNEDFARTWFLYSSSRKDIGQYTIPFLDSRLTAPSPRVPLEGISLIRRTREQSGGFIAFELKTVDIAELVNPELSPEAIEMFKDDYENEIINNVIEIEKK